MGCYFFLEGSFPTLGLNLDLLHCGQILYCLNHQGSPNDYWFGRLLFTYSWIGQHLNQQTDGCSEELHKMVVQSLSHVQVFTTPWAAVYQGSLPFTISLSLLKLMSIESVMPSNHLSFCSPHLLLPSVFPRIKVRDFYRPKWAGTRKLYWAFSGWLQQGFFLIWNERACWSRLGNLCWAGKRWLVDLGLPFLGEPSIET